MVLNEVLARRLTGAEAAEMLGLTVRHTRRLLARYRQEGAAALMHGNRGRVPANKIDAAVEAEVVRLAETRYLDYNDSHFTEELEQQHEIALSVPTVRRIRRQQGLASPRKRRAPKHRRQRQRYPQSGMLLQLDASKHDWLEGRGPWLALHSAIDDATNEVPWAVFRLEEDATGYALLLHHTSQTHGLPLGVYADRHTIFQSPKRATIEEQLAGLEPRSQLGHLFDRLDVTLIAAYSPQAKGRVERLFQTLQDRLVKELRQAGAGSLEEANEVLQAYLPRFNQRFMKPPAQPGSAYRPPLTLAQANEQLCFRYWRTVAKDHTMALFGRTVSLPELPARLNLAGRRVELRQRMDGRLAVAYQGQVIAMLQPAQLGPPKLDAFEPAPQHLVQEQLPASLPAPMSVAVQKAARKAPPDHPWRNGYEKRMLKKQQQQR